MFFRLKLFTSIVILLFLASCSKTEDKKNTEIVKKDTTPEKVSDSLDHIDRHDHKEGELCIDPVASKVASFSMEGKYQEAIDVLVAAKDVPGYQWDKEKIYESMVYLYDRTKQYEKNLDVWRDGHSKGIVFKMDKTKKHFEPYLLLEGFDDIYEKDLEMQKSIEEDKLK
ncbi:MAG: hypothetical protein JXR69_11490 [Candidatus Delongbacteria bacterium]|nr:hypothetical protein [Candidatus Delongbacteria bacterium]